MKCAVIGGANIDIGGFPVGGMLPGDSIPGRVRRSAGGVGLNIACNLSRLGVETHLIAALGSDAFADILRAACHEAGVHLEHALTFDADSSVYLYIADAAGEMALAVNDMALCERLTPEALSEKLEFLNRMDAVVLDANLPGRTLTWLAENLRPPLIADAVSTSKARRLLPALPRLEMVKPNALEAAALSGLPVEDTGSASDAARQLLRMGARQAFVTLGARGVVCADADACRFIPAVPVRLVNATGAGDAFTAALTWAHLRGFNLADRARAGLAASALCAESPDAVSPNLTAEAVLERMQRYYSYSNL